MQLISLSSTLMSLKLLLFTINIKVFEVKSMVGVKASYKYIFNDIKITFSNSVMS